MCVCVCVCHKQPIFSIFNDPNRDNNDGDVLMLVMVWGIDGGARIVLFA